jgi:hypothetical protein
MKSSLKPRLDATSLIRGGDGIVAFILMCLHRKTFEAAIPRLRTREVTRGGSHTQYKSLTDEQIALVVNCPENVAVTLRRINQSKR